MSFIQKKRGACSSPGCCPPPVLPCPCPEPAEAPGFYAQYGVAANPPSGTFVPFIPIFNSGNRIILKENTVILLPQGYLYLVDYIFLATPEADSYFQIVPMLNESLRLNYSFYAPSGSGGRNASASGSFTTTEAGLGDLLLSFRLTYPGTVRNIDISGSVSVTPLQKLH